MQAPAFITFINILIFMTILGVGDLFSVTTVQGKEGLHILDEATVNSLVDHAAELKALKTVLKTGANLPLPKKPMALPINTQVTSSEIAQAVLNFPTDNKKMTELARCTYQQQRYVPGDTVKTSVGWLRCTSTIIFLSSEKIQAQGGSPAWVALQ